MGKMIVLDELVEEPTKVNIDFICEFVHEAMRQLAEMGGDPPISNWLNASDEDKHLTRDGVMAVLKDDDYSPQKSHDKWLANKQQQGWHYGNIKDPEQKTHPSMVPYDKLSDWDKLKDIVFVDTVRMLQKQLK